MIKVEYTNNRKIHENRVFTSDLLCGLLMGGCVVPEGCVTFSESVAREQIINHLTFVSILYEYKIVTEPPMSFEYYEDLCDEDIETIKLFFRVCGWDFDKQIDNKLYFLPRNSYNKDWNTEDVTQQLLNAIPKK